jgi:hypothetical protein
MRLEKVATHGHTLKQKLIFGMIRVFSGFRAVDVVRTLAYRKDFFGHPHSDWTQAAMRGPGFWPVADRELFAAFVSRKNRCVF